MDDVRVAPRLAVPTRSAVEAAAGEKAAPLVLRREWRFVVAVALGVLALTSLPYLYGWLSAPAGLSFRGMMLDVPDHLQYFSWMRELAAAPLAANKLTPEPNPPIFFNLLWWGLGRAAGWLGLGYAGIFQMLRWAATLLFAVVVYRLAARVFLSTAQRRAAFLLVFFGSGLGWLLVVLKYTLTRGELLFPLDLYTAEGNTFLCILAFPHFVAAALYAVVFDVMLGIGRTRPLRAALIAGLLALFFGWQHAYDLIIVWAVLGTWVLLIALRDRRIPWPLAGGLALVVLISVWPALYSLLLTRWSPIWREVLAQFDNAGVFTPPPWRLPLLLGLPFLLALAVALRDRPWRLKGVSDTDLLVRGWFWVSFLLIYLPVDYQIHMLNGWQIPIAFLATRGLFEWLAPAARRGWGRLRAFPLERVQRGAVALALLLVLPANLYLFTWRFVDLSRHAMPYYLRSDEVSALRWLEAHAQPDDVVFSSLEFGQYVPAETGAHAFLAHWAQTADFYTKQEIVRRFYAGEASAEDLGALDAFSVDYVVAGPQEHLLGAFDPASLEGWRPQFEAGEVVIYARAS